MRRIKNKAKRALERLISRQMDLDCFLESLNECYHDCNESWDEVRKWRITSSESYSHIGEDSRFLWQSITPEHQDCLIDVFATSGIELEEDNEATIGEMKDVLRQTGILKLVTIDL